MRRRTHERATPLCDEEDPRRRESGWPAGGDWRRRVVLQLARGGRLADLPMWMRRRTDCKRDAHSPALRSAAVAVATSERRWSLRAEGTSNEEMPCAGGGLDRDNGERGGD